MKKNALKTTAIVALVLLFNNCGDGFKSLNFTKQHSTGTTPPPSASPTIPPSPTGAPSPTLAPSTTPTAQPSPLPSPTTTATPPPPPPPVGSTLTTLKVSYAENKSTDQYITFGQTFRAGHIPNGNSITARYDDGSLIPIQVDAKAKHRDGSLRHAIITLKIKGASTNAKQNIHLVRTNSVQALSPIPLSSLLATSFNSALSVNIGGTTYTASARDLIQLPNAKIWLSGNFATEWIVSGPLRTSAGQAHPHLQARFLIRAYEGLGSVRISAGVENTWSYVPNPQEISYTASLSVGSTNVMSNQNINHLRSARWRKVAYWGNDPKEHIEHQLSYLISTRSVPSYDQTIVPSQTKIQEIYNSYNSRKNPMQLGNMDQAMAQGGASDWIGPMPQWTALFLLSMNRQSKDVTLGNADLAGTWNIHYRDEVTDLPLTLDDHPFATVIGDTRGMINPKTGKEDMFPNCSNCDNEIDGEALNPDVAHQPNFAYIPYMLTGDYYFLEENQFWTVFSLILYSWDSNGYKAGCLVNDQVRAQGWGLRTLAQTAYITPDNHPLKNYFETRLQNNIRYYMDKYINTVNNPLGANTNGCCAYAYRNTGGWNEGLAIAPWQQAFFAYGVSVMVELGYIEAKPLMDYFRFTVSTMVAPGFCWIYASSYDMPIRPNGKSSATYSTFAQVYQATAPANIFPLACNSQAMATALNQQVGQMIGYADGAYGYPSNLQPYLALAAEYGVPEGLAAWTKFISRTVKPNYNSEPNYAIVPRTD